MIIDPIMYPLKNKKKLNFTMKYTVDDAIYDLKDAFEKKNYPILSMM